MKRYQRVNQRRYPFTIRIRLDSDIVDTHSDLKQKVSTIASESLSKINRNQCPRSFGMTVHDASENALFAWWPE